MNVPSFFTWTWMFLTRVVIRILTCEVRRRGETFLSASSIQTMERPHRWNVMVHLFSRWNINIFLYNFIITWTNKSNNIKRWETQNILCRILIVFPYCTAYFMIILLNNNQLLQLGNGDISFSIIFFTLVICLFFQHC